jgi:CheY-like chemotaxis protein
MSREDGTLLPLTPGPLVLVVDDELTPRSIVSRMLRTLGYPVRSCPAARDALRFLASHPGDVRLLLADLIMPRMDGGELVERALDLDPGLRVALMAGRDDSHAAALMAGYRDLPFLGKPVEFGALARLAGELVGPPARAAGEPRSMHPRVRRRVSGHHQV